MTDKTIPITILTGFLGSGKTTLINKIIEQNPKIKFGLIINEFGEKGIDGDLVQANSEEEIVEISNVCLCCVARTDLIKSAEALINTGKIDYILIETSGLAEPMPIAQTFAVDNIEGRVELDSVICLIDSVNHNYNKENCRVAVEQTMAADIILLNKVEDAEVKTIEEIKLSLKSINPQGFVLENSNDFHTSNLIETGKWTYEEVVSQEDEQDHKCKCEDKECNCEKCNCDNEDCKCDEAKCDCENESCSCSHDHPHENEHHHHEHHEVDEYVFVTENKLDMDKFQEWVLYNFPENVVRSKGFLRFDNQYFPTFLFQMVGAKKLLLPFKPTREAFDAKKSRIVFIGKSIDKEKILKDLQKLEIA